MMRALVLIYLVLTFSTNSLAIHCENPTESSGLFLSATEGIKDYNDCLIACRANNQCKCFSYYNETEICVQLKDCDRSVSGNNRNTNTILLISLKSL